MKQAVELIIDTTDSNTIIVGLAIEGKKDIKTLSRPLKKSQVVLPVVTELLKTHKKHFSDISTIRVNTGPGSFTGIRVGLSIANTIGLLYQIPINGKKPGVPEQPVYE